MKLIDVLSNESFQEKHIVGAINVCVYETAFPQKIQDAISDKTQRITVYGYSDETFEAQKAKDIMDELGYTNVSILPGGLVNATNTESHNPQPTQGEFHINTADSSVKWTARNIANRHFGKIPVSGFVTIKNNELIDGKLELDVSSITCEDLTDETMNGYLIDHLKSDDFFSTHAYPTASVIIIKSEKLDNRASKPQFHITANVTIKGITQKVFFDAYVEKRDQLVLSAHFDIDRTLWNVQYGSEKFFAKLGMHIIEDIVSFDIILKAK